MITTPSPFWDSLDHRLNDTDNDGRVDINKHLEDELLNRHSETRSINLFHPFQTTASNKVTFLLQPFINPNTKLSFCPTFKNEYDNNILKVLKPILGNNTEPLYYAEGKDNRTMFIPLSQIKSDRFHIINGKEINVTRISSTVEDVYFRWPKHSKEKYKIVHHHSSSMNFPDKRFACVPFLEDEKTGKL